jgi:hypothetical protein
MFGLAALKLAWTLGDPIKKAKMIAIALLAIALVSAASYGLWRVHMAFQHEATDKVVIDAQKEKIGEQKNVIADQTTQMHHDDESQKVSNTVVSGNIVQKQQNKTKTDQAIQVVKQKVGQVQDNAQLNEEQKTQQIAQIHISSMWEGYCDATDGTGAGCSAPAASPTATS